MHPPLTTPCLRGTFGDWVFYSKRVVKPANKVLARKLVFYMLRLPLSAKQRRDLLGDYRAALGYDRADTTVALPPRFD